MQMWRAAGWVFYPIIHFLNTTVDDFIRFVWESYFRNRREGEKIKHDRSLVAEKLVPWASVDELSVNVCVSLLWRRRPPGFHNRLKSLWLLVAKSRSRIWTQQLESQTVNGLRNVFKLNVRLSLFLRREDLWFKFWIIEIIISPFPER